MLVCLHTCLLLGLLSFLIADHCVESRGAPAGPPLGPRREAKSFNTVRQHAILVAGAQFGARRRPESWKSQDFLIFKYIISGFESARTLAQVYRQRRPLETMKIIYVSVIPEILVEM